MHQSSYIHFSSEIIRDTIRFTNAFPDSSFDRCVRFVVNSPPSPPKKMFLKTTALRADIETCEFTLTIGYNVTCPTYNLLNNVLSVSSSLSSSHSSHLKFPSSRILRTRVNYLLHTPQSRKCQFLISVYTYVELSRRLFVRNWELANGRKIESGTVLRVALL